MLKKKAIQLLTELTQAHGCSGCEYPVRNIIRSELKSNLATDKSGSIIHTLKGKYSTPVIMIEAHMDEVGFMVQQITDEGFIKFIPMGGWSPNTLLAQRVRILGNDRHETLGVIAAKPPHFLKKEDQNRAISIQEMYIDVGAKNFDEVNASYGINIGDTIVPESSITPLRNPDLLMSKAFDNRVGVSLAIHAAQSIKKTNHPNLISVVGCVQEEVGTRGVKTALELVNPDAAIVLEGPPADDIIGAEDEGHQGVLGNGPQIRLVDSSAILNRPFSNFVMKVAEEHNIPYQVAVRRSGGTDAKIIQWHRLGIPTIVLGVPARYIHTHNSIININDYINAMKLLVEVTKQLNESVVKQFTDFTVNGAVQ